MPRSGTKFTPMHGGGFSARKAIPADVREAYAEQFGKSREERFNSGPIPKFLATARWREWSSEIEARFANIRAAHKGERRTLTPLQARAHAGDWYRWYVGRQEADTRPAAFWQDYQASMWGGLYEAATAAGMLTGDPLDFWDREPAMREHVRPIIGDETKSRQFLASKNLALDPASEAMFLDYVTRDFFVALALLARRARGDHSPDEYPKHFPQPSAADPTLSAWALFEKWIAGAKPAAGTIARWRTVFLRLAADFPSTNAAALLPDDMQMWANGLIDSDRAAGTVARVWVRATRTVFNWGVAEKLITRNPFVGWRIKVPKEIRTRETKALTTAEISTILNAALAIAVRSKIDAAKRWGPWLASYSGARMGEIMQLRGIDIIAEDGVHAMKLSPEAGTIKTGVARIVPLHEHLVEQGFLDFVKTSGAGPLFYNAPKAKTAPNGVTAPDPTNPSRARSARPRELVAAWVRDIGVTDPELSPNHAWRHSFKAIGFRCGMSEKVLDVIVGHAPASEGRKYGGPTLADRAQELRKFPRFKWPGGCAGATDIE